MSRLSSSSVPLCEVSSTPLFIPESAEIYDTTSFLLVEITFHLHSGATLLFIHPTPAPCPLSPPHLILSLPSPSPIRVWVHIPAHIYLPMWDTYLPCWFWYRVIIRTLTYRLPPSRVRPYATRWRQRRTHRFQAHVRRQILVSSRFFFFKSLHFEIENTVKRVCVRICGVDFSIHILTQGKKFAILSQKIVNKWNQSRQQNFYCVWIAVTKIRSFLFKFFVMVNFVESDFDQIRIL